MFGQNPTVVFEGGNICPTDSWKLVFNDEFNGTTIDQSKWFTAFPYDPNGGVNCQVCRTHGSTQEIFLDQNVVESNGTLKLITRNDNPTWMSVTTPYSCGTIYSKWNFAFQYGSFVASCKMPAGAGFWPAFWLFGGIGTEIDVFEYGSKYPTNQHTTIHHWSGSTDVAQITNTVNTGVDLSQAFHIYRADWDPFYIRFYIDNNQVFQICRFLNTDGSFVTSCNLNPGVYEVQTAYPQGSPNNVNIIAGSGVGGPFNDNNLPASSVCPSQMEIDYIRVYQRTPQAGFTDLCAAESVTGPDDICDGNQHTYQFNGTNSTNPTWNLSSNLQQISSTSNSVTVQVVPSASGAAWVQANFAQADPCSQTQFTKNVWIGSPAKPTFSVAAKTPICPGNTTTTSVGAVSGAASYNWSFVPVGGSGGTTSGLVLTPSVNTCGIDAIHLGTYQIQVSTTNACGTSAITNSTNLVISNLPVCGPKSMIVTPEKEEYRVDKPVMFPNPANQNLTIIISDSEIKHYVISMYDVLGNKVLAKTQISGGTENHQIDLDISTLSNGMYIVMIENGKEVYQEKIMVNH